jgi:hypothetical protein
VLLSPVYYWRRAPVLEGHCGRAAEQIHVSREYVGEAHNMMTNSYLKPGDWVEVLSKEDILRTLDEQGQLEGMPFMPEMFAYCGKRLRVHKRAHKTCDTVFPTRSRRICNAVHLDTRCTGEAHGGCEARCPIFWKEAWLKPVHEASSSPRVKIPLSGGCTEAAVQRATRCQANLDEANPTYVCQATRLPYFSEDLSPYDFRQYIEDYASGNIALGRWIRGIIYITYYNLINLGIGLGRPLRWLYDRFQRLWGGLPYPRRRGKIPKGQPTPMAELKLQEDEWVRIKSYDEILATCNEDNLNRGLYFDAELVPYCGREYRVLKRVTRIINEQTGKMMTMKNPCLILENVVCQARYSYCRMFCPRELYPYWREIWLERVVDDKSDHGKRVGGAGATPC